MNLITGIALPKSVEIAVLQSDSAKKWRKEPEVIRMQWYLYIEEKIKAIPTYIMQKK